MEGCHAADHQRAAEDRRQPPHRGHDGARLRHRENGRKHHEDVPAGVHVEHTRRNHRDADASRAGGAHFRVVAEVPARLDHGRFYREHG